MWEKSFEIQFVNLLILYGRSSPNRITYFSYCIMAITSILLSGKTRIYLDSEDIFTSLGHVWIHPFYQVIDAYAADVLHFKVAGRPIISI